MRISWTYRRARYSKTKGMPNYFLSSIENFINLPWNWCRKLMSFCEPTRFRANQSRPLTRVFAHLNQCACLFVCLFVFLVLIDCKWYIPFDLLLWLLRIWFYGTNQKIILTCGVEEKVSDTFHSLPNEPISAREKYYSLEWCILMPHSMHLNSGVDLGTR